MKGEKAQQPHCLTLYLRLSLSASDLECLLDVPLHLTVNIILLPGKRQNRDEDRYEGRDKNGDEDRNEDGDEDRDARD